MKGQLRNDIKNGFDWQQKKEHLLLPHFSYSRGPAGSVSHFLLTPFESSFRSEPISTTHFSLHLSYPRSLSTFPPCCSRYHSSLISLVLYISSTAPHIFIHIYLSYSCTPKQPKYQIKYRTMVHQPDNPPVASTESGGPATSPTLEERPHDFRYEVCSFSGQWWGKDINVTDKQLTDRSSKDTLSRTGLNLSISTLKTL